MKQAYPVCLQFITASLFFGIFLTTCQPKKESTDQTALVFPEQVDFNFHIKPILSDRCYACHGPDEKARKGNFRLDTQAGAFALLDSLSNQYAIVPGNSDASHILDRMNSKDPDYMMPPPESKLQISDYEIELINRWIQQGAKWKKHWAFIRPQKTTLPKTQLEGWAKNPIDHFTLAQMEQKNLTPSPAAQKTKLIRRLSFDLTGLPPSQEDLEAFQNDDSEEAYEKLVDKFLQMPTYGERMAMEWMDLARYADSHGYQDDIERSMWPWRDWVIDAFNKNMPYDQFVSWQLAGDLLPEASYEQKLATGFNRNHKITQEVGVIDEEYRVTYVLDRVNTFSTAFLGLTVECAQCHDHKYDPISQKEYYQLFSFFNQVPERGRVDYGVEVAAPSLPIPEEKVTEIQAFIDQLYDTQAIAVKKYQDQHWSAFDAQKLKAQNTATEKGSISKRPTYYFPLDYLAENQTPEICGSGIATAINNPIAIQGKYSGGMEFMGKNGFHFHPNQPFDLNRPFSVSFWIQSLDGGISGPVLTFLGKNNQKPIAGIHVTSRKNLNIYFRSSVSGQKLSLMTKETLPINRWTNIVLTYDGSKKVDGIQLFMDGRLMENYSLEESLKASIPKCTDLVIGTSNLQGDKRGLMAGQLDEIQWFNTALNRKEIQTLSTLDPIKDLLAQSSWTGTELKRLYYEQLFHQDAFFKELVQRQREYRIRQGRMEDIILKPTMVMEDMDTIRPTYILDRGQYDARGERVEPGTPKAVLSFNNQLPANRLGLANWLFHAENPLTARVAVNRYWQLFFGRGIVATPGDFGSQGTLPSHPALLDWLALEFMGSGWNLKHLIKLIVSSATYQQSTNMSDELLQKDPENIYLARGPQSRLSAEMIRDHALSISGLLGKEIGGPGVKPYQPEGLWLEVASGNQSLRKYIQDHGHELYRRSLYTFWKRTMPPPSLVIFDAPSRELCTVKRRTTSTPMQALVLLNDPQFIEASRLIATRMLLEKDLTRTERIEFAFVMATSRKATQKEVTVLEKLFEKEMLQFQENPNSAEQLLAIGEYPILEHVSAIELATYTIIANTILNLTETIQKG